MELKAVLPPVLPTNPLHGVESILVAVEQLDYNDVGIHYMELKDTGSSPDRQRAAEACVGTNPLHGVERFQQTPMWGGLAV